MSTEPSLDPQLIEQTKQQIRSLVNEIGQLSKTDISPEEFHAEFLPRVVSALAAIGGAVWTLDEGRLSLGYQINIQETKLRDKPDEQMQHGRLLQKVLSTGEGMLAPPHSGVGEDDDDATNPTDFLLVLGPIQTEQEVVGVVEVFQRPESGPNTQKGYLRFLLQMCELAGDYFKSRQLRHFSDRQVLWTQLEDFTRLVHSSLDPRETAYTIANEGRRLIECDRVSVAIRKGRKCTIEAVSGQDLFDKRSNTVRLLGQLATAVVSGEEPVWYTGDTTDMAPQVEDAIQEYVDESHSKTVAILPLIPITREEEEEDPEEKEAPREPVGALIVELIEDNRVPEPMRQRVEVVSSHSCTAMANSLEHNNLFLMPLWRSLGKMQWVLKARTLPKTIAISAAVLAVLLSLVVIPRQLKLHGKGTLEPVERRKVYPQVGGVVKERMVYQGKQVKEGDVLLKLKNLDDDLEIKRVIGERNVTIDHINGLQRRASKASSSRSPEDERTDFHNEIENANIKLSSLNDQLDSLSQKRENLLVRSPITGTVLISWEVEKNLLGRTVQPGQELMTVANLEGDWELEVRMPGKRLGHIGKAQKKLREKDPNAQLTVEYTLATDSNNTRRGTVEKIQRSAEVVDEEGNTVLMKVAINEKELFEELPELRTGATVNTKVHCGYRPLGYTIFHDAVAFFHSRIWFRFF